MAFLKSKTVWGIFIVVAALVARQFGVETPVDTTNPEASGISQETLDGITSIFTAIGSAIALYGRAVAQGPLIGK